MSASRLFALIAALVLGALVWWFIGATEWVEEKVRTPPSEAFLRDPHFAIKKVLTDLGAQTQSVESLTRLPPTSTRLVLSSAPWRLFPEQGDALARWVKDGGQVVIDARLLNRSDTALPWLPVQVLRTSAPLTEPAGAARRRHAAPDESSAECRFVHESPELSPAWQSHQAYRLCGSVQTHLRTRETLIWALAPRPSTGATAQAAAPTPPPATDDDPDDEIDEENDDNADDSDSDTRRASPKPLPLPAYELVQVPLGRGRVTVMDLSAVQARRVLDGDHALVLVSALKLQKGEAVWFFARDERPGLLRFLWEHASPVIVLCAIALLLALWRGAVAFGPPLRALPRARRSMAEQIRGTAAFIFARGGLPLYLAQVRALDQAARRVIGKYDSLGQKERAKALAERTGIDAETLARALTRSYQKRRATVQASLAVLETARRRLLPRTPNASSSDSTKDSPP